ncbi:MAG: hypothetical protein MJ086_04005 [Lachnospiraceae bacterium]|nr:hypothetical protein [Lachnospiraceae bacterium]
MKNKTTCAIFQKVLLLVTSLIFYACAGVKNLLVLAAVILINYLAGRFIEKFNGSDAKAGSMLITLITVILNGAALAFYKYFGLLTGKSIFMPLAFSFITFQSIAYIFDVYRKKISGEKNLLEFALFITFFGQLVQGPIIRYNDFKIQMNGPTSFYEKMDVSMFASGVKRFCYGIGKKIIIANTVALVSEQIWAAHGDAVALAQANAGSTIYSIPTTVAWFGLLLYTLQIYFDFSGYTDMAIGISRMFGIEICENFDYPYTSLSIREFWRRWHISLSSWFRDYIYIPFGGSKKGTFRTCINLIIVFLVTGIWHGADFTFIIWGGIFAVFTVLERLFLGKLLDKNPVKIINWLYTIFVVMMGWVFFRAPDLNSALCYFKSLFGNGMISSGTASLSTSAMTMTVVSLLSVDLIAAIIAGILFCGFIQRLLQKKYMAICNSVIVIGIDTLLQIAILIWSMLMILQGSFIPSVYGGF